MSKLLKTLYDCGAITDKEIETLGIEASVVNDMVRQEQLFLKVIDGKPIYYLSDFGEKLYRLESKKTLFFRCNNFKKMCALVDFYAKLSDEERETWKNKDTWYSEGIVKPIPDATYEKDGKTIGVYVQTSSFSKRTLNFIKEFAEEQKLETVNFLKE